MFRFYDDELHNLILVAHRDLKEIIYYTANYDYHPPLQYLLNKISLELFGLNEFLLKLPSIILIILSVILCSHLVFKITGSVKLSLLCGLITITNPLILLWGTSIRWYPLWTFLTMLSLYSTITLFTISKKTKRIRSQLLLFITVVLALYTNYQTIILIMTLLLSAFFLDLKEKDKRYDHLKSIFPVIIGVVILFIPYMNTFLHHLGTFIQQKQIHFGFTGSSPILSGAYFIFSVLFGNSIYPWEVSFIILISIIVVASLFLLLLSKLRISDKSENGIKAFFQQDKKKEIFLLMMFTIILFILFLVTSIISGSLQARGYLIIPLLLIAISIIGFNHFRKERNRKFYNLITLIVFSFLVIWMIGSYNVIIKKDLHKASLMDPIGEAIDYIYNSARTEGKNYLIFTYDPVLTYYLINSELFEEVAIFSPYKDETTALINSFSESMDNSPIYLSTSTKILFIESYPGSLMPAIRKLENFKQYLFKESVQNEKPKKIGFDTNAEIKRKFFPSAGMIDWRYIIYSLDSKAKLDAEILTSFDSLKVY